MTTNRNETLVLVFDSSMHQLEKFVESICDNLFINETYFGNILMTVSEVFNLAKSSDRNFILECNYITDFQVLSILFKGLNDNTTQLLKTNSVLGETPDSLYFDSLFLIQSLSDRIEKTEDNTLQISFDIGAIHNRIYTERSNLLKTYLNRLTAEKVQINDDLH